MKDEGYTAHSVIEKNIKRAKKKGEPFQVNELTFSDFYDLKSLTQEMGFNITKNDDGDRIKISDIKMFELKKGENSYI